MPERFGSAQRDRACEAALRRALQGVSLISAVHAFRRVTSTMDVAHALVQRRTPHATLVFADRQDRGRGRLGRAWSSPAGGLYCSVIVWPVASATEIPQLSLVAGLAVAETVQESAGARPAIRWPNDVLVAGKKVAGILLEATSGAVIIGIGVNAGADLSQLPPQAASLPAIGAAAVDPIHLAGRLCRRFQAWYDVWGSRGFRPIREALCPFIGMFGQAVHVTAGTRHVDGTADDLDESGRLVVRLESGLLQVFAMGEVTRLRTDGDRWNNPDGDRATRGGR